MSGFIGFPARRHWMVAVIILFCSTVGWTPPVNGQQQDAPPQSLQVLPKVFRGAEQTVRPTLVTIESFGGVSAVAGKIGGIRSRGEGNTTGVMMTADGYVVTSTFNFITRPPVITVITCLLYTSPSPRDQRGSRMPSSA